MTYLSHLTLALNRPNGPSLDQQVGQLFAQGEQGAWYDPTALDPTWRRNLLSYSEQFDNAVWTKEGLLAFGGGSVANDIAAPDASVTADKLIENTSNSLHRLYFTLATATSGVSYTASIYVKAAGRRYFRLECGNSSGSQVAVFDLATQSVVQKTGAGTIAVMQDTGNGWYRCSVAGSTPNTTAYVICAISTVNQLGYDTYTGNGTDGFYLWGAQLEDNITTATPYQRIVTPGITYQADVNPMPTMYQESYGSTPVATVETAVGLILDKRKNYVLGSELVDTINTAAAWTALGTNTVTESSGEVTITYSNNAAGATAALSQAAGLSSDLTVGKWYLVKGEAKVNTGAVNLAFTTSSTITGPNITSTSFVSWQMYLLATNATTNTITFSGMGTGEAITVRNISVKQVDGNHAYQTTSASRPILRARYNLLTYSEQFDNAAWTKLGTTCTGNATTAPDGTSTADAIYENNQNSGHGIRYASFAVLSGARYTFSVYAKYNGRKNIAIGGYGVDPVAYYSFNLVDGTSFFYGAGGALVQPESFSIKDVGSGWYRLSITYVSTGTGSKTLEIVGLNDDATTGTYQGDITKGFYLWGAQVNSGTSALSYQRIAASTDYALGPDFPPYLSFDGTDDSLITGSIDFSAKDEISVFAGLMKESASQGMVAELTATIASNNGAFSLEAPDGDIAADNYVFSSKGTSKASCTVNGYAAPTRNVVTGLADISVPTVQTRVDGVAATAVTTDQGTGKFSNAVLYLGRRNQATLPFKGRIHGLVIRGASSTPTEIASAESLMAQKVKVTL